MFLITQVFEVVAGGQGVPEVLHVEGGEVVGCEAPVVKVNG